MKLSELTPEEKRDLLCAALKWEYDEATDNVIFTDEDGNICGHLWESLDAMHEAEKSAGLHEDSFRGRKLRRIWNTKVRHIDFPQYATAAQRLDAFLLAKGLAE